ncbi:hypothetical protein VNO77_20065 [Canavalia gladiata]|uniref:Uncharacterized protein n=1 Tax=Canavalia gladiata TaxID=3824 RepID=A0AAN9LPH5_CANGL
MQLGLPLSCMMISIALFGTTPTDPVGPLEHLSLVTLSPGLFTQWASDFAFLKSMGSCASKEVGTLALHGFFVTSCMRVGILSRFEALGDKTTPRHHATQCNLWLGCVVLFESSNFFPSFAPEFEPSRFIETFQLLLEFSHCAIVSELERSDYLPPHNLTVWRHPELAALVKLETTWVASFLAFKLDHGRHLIRNRQVSSLRSSKPTMDQLPQPVRIRYFRIGLTLALLFLYLVRTSPLRVCFHEIQDYNRLRAEDPWLDVLYQRSARLGFEAICAQRAPLTLAFPGPEPGEGDSWSENIKPEAGSIFPRHSLFPACFPPLHSGSQSGSKFLCKPGVFRDDPEASL